MRKERETSRRSAGSGDASLIHPRPSDAKTAVPESVICRWAEKGLVPVSVAGGIGQQPFTGFPPIRETELPSVMVEAVD